MSNINKTDTVSTATNVDKADRQDRLEEESELKKDHNLLFIEYLKSMDIGDTTKVFRGRIDGYMIIERVEGNEMFQMYCQHKLGACDLRGVLTEICLEHNPEDLLDDFVGYQEKKTKILKDMAIKKTKKNPS